MIQRNGRPSRLLGVIALALVLGVLYIASRASPFDSSTTTSLISNVQNDEREEAVVNTAKKKVLLTGGAGFIGSHCGEYLLKRGDDIVVVDEVNNYYNVSIKHHNLHLLQQIADTFEGAGKLEIHVEDICNKQKLTEIFNTHEQSGEPITHILHIAARAGVRPSIVDPLLYVHSNVEGTMVMLEMARMFKIKNFVFASTSSVYGENKKVPFSETDDVSIPVSPYAATKRATELMAATYNHLYDIPITALRFFTVYGPRGRPDMAPFQFIDSIYRGKAIKKYGDGTTSRDYTYIEDIVQGVIAALDRTFKKFQIFNLGGSSPTTLNDFIATIEHVLQRQAIITPFPAQLGDVPRTFADVSKSRRLLGYKPRVPLLDGIQRTAKWYIETFN